MRLVEMPVLRGSNVPRQLLQFCRVCEVYTLKTECPKCQTKVTQAPPLKWSPEDKRAYLRRKLENVADDEWSKSLSRFNNTDV
ncbi:MAG: hypothetical protein CMA25_04420 [Euryarchaeota archaeon]|nr:hypothetical protein [Euryarchaeota archaeon]